MNRMLDPVWSCTHKEEPLSREIRAEYYRMTVRYRLNELVPGKNEVGNHKQKGSECI